MKDSLPSSWRLLPTSPSWEPTPRRSSNKTACLCSIRCPVFRAAVEDRLNGTTPSVIAARFQNSVADLLAQACVTIRDRTGLNVVALSGGVFQNAFVFTGTRRRLEKMGFEVLFHRILPPNDGGISLGQVAVAAARAARARVK